MRWREKHGEEALPWDYNAWDAAPTTIEAREYQRVRGKGDGRVARASTPTVQLTSETPAFVAAVAVSVPTRGPPLCAMPAGAANACFGVPEGVAGLLRPSKRVVAATVRGAEVLRAVVPGINTELSYYGAPVTLATGSQAQVAVTLAPQALEGARICRSAAEREAADKELQPGATVWCTLHALDGRLERTLATSAIFRAVEQVRPLAPGLAAKGAGAVESRAVRVTLERGQEAADVPALHAIYEEGVRELCSRLRARAASDEYLRPALCTWIDRLQAEPACPVPDVLLAAARRPPIEQLTAEPFRHRCRIHDTRAVDPAWPQRVHASMQLPHCWQDALTAHARPEVQAALGRRAGYHAARLRSGERGQRPEAESWSVRDAVREPWRDLQLDYSLGAGRTRLLPVHMPALCTHLHLRAIREYFPAHSFKNQRVVSMWLGGAVFQDELPWQIMLTSNLHGMYEVQGGVDVVAAELHHLTHERKWYRAIELGLITTPLRINPRSATERQGEIARPRGLAEMGAPRKELYAHRTGELTPALNPSAGPMRNDFGLADPKWHTECKPTLEDACANGCILQVAATILQLALIIFAFDYKAFFHQLCYRMSEVWKCGFNVPAMQAGGKASPLLVTLLECVVAMGASPSSNICQDVANALMAKLLQLFDEADAPRLERLRRENEQFDHWMRVREAMPHDDYGTMARLASSLQYTDDHWGCVVGAEGADTFLTVFHRFIGPAWVGEPTLQGMADAQEAAERVAAAYEREYRAFAERPVAPPRTYWAEGEWAGCVRSPVADDSAYRLQTGGPWRISARLPKQATPQQREERAEAYAAKLFSVSGLAQRARRQLRGQSLACDEGEHLSCAHVLAEVANCSEQRFAELRRQYADAAREGGPGTAPGAYPVLPGAVPPAASGGGEGVGADMQIVGSYMREALRSDGRPCGGINLEPAKGAKWHAGSAVQWVGGGISPYYGLVWVPQAKAVVAIDKAQWAMSGKMPAAEYRKFVFYLQHLCFMVGGAHYRMRGLWRPLQAGQELEQGPDTPVHCDEEMRGRLKNWVNVLLNAPGCSALAAFETVRAPGSGLEWVLRGDAALEGDGDPGMGGWFYGRWWRVALDSDTRLRHPLITIPVLENITASINLSQYAPLLRGAQRVLVESDALATAGILQRGEAGAAGEPAMVIVNEELLDTPEYKSYVEPVPRLDARHTYGAANPFPDIISRGKLALLEEMCAALGIEHRRDALSGAAAAFLETCLRRITGAPPPPVSAAAEASASLLGSEYSCRMDGDGPPSKTTSRPSASGAGGKLAPPKASRQRMPTGLKLLAVATAAFARAAAHGDAPSPGAREPPVGRVVAAAAAAMHADQAAQQSRRARYRAWGDWRRRSEVRPTAAREAGGHARSVVQASQPEAAPAARRGRTTRAEVEARLAVAHAKRTVLAEGARPAGARAAEHMQVLRDAQRRRVEAAMGEIRRDQSELALRPGDPGLLRLLLERAAAATLRRTPLSVASLDASYWRFWCDWCNLMGTSPLRTDVDANRRCTPAETALRIGAFMMWVITNPNFMPSSMLARLRGAARVHKACGYDFGPLTAVAEACRGATQEYLDEHGPWALTPKRKEPFTNEMLIILLTLASGVVPGYPGMVVGATLAWLGVRVFITLAAASGFRKADMALDSGVPFGKRHLSLYMVRWWIGGRWVERPTEETKRRGYTRDDRVHVIPPPSKADQDGTKWSASQVIVRYHPTAPLNLFRELAEYEVQRAVDGEERKLAPLLLDEHGRHWTKQRLASFFDALLTMVFGAEKARKHSVHSFRIYLACALRAAGASRELIMEMLRWSSDDALKLYARINSVDDADWRDRAAVAAVDSVRSGTLTAMRPAMGSAEERADVLERAGQADVAAVDPADVPRVDIDAAVGQLQTAQPRLEAAALQTDEEVRLATPESLEPLLELVAPTA